MSLPTRAIVFFSGPVGFVVKIVLLAIANAIAIWAFTILAGRHNWIAASVLAAATLAIDALYLTNRRAIPAKFLIPGTIFLLAFQLIPIFYTVNVAFSTYSTGHIGSKADAVNSIKTNSLAETENSKSYSIAPARDAGGKLVLVLRDDDTHQSYIGTQSGLKPLPASAVKVGPDGTVTAASGYKLIKGNELFGLDKQISGFVIPAGTNGFIQPQGLDTAVVLRPTLRYDPRTQTFTRIKDGAVFRDNGKGSFVSAGGQELEPGWRTHIGFTNFSSMIHNPLIRKPFVRVFIWTMIYPTLTVLFSFALGLFLAITLDKPGLRFRRLYRAALVIPYAVPGFLSLLVWQGLLNDEFGVVNHILGHIGVHVAWLFDPNWAKVSIILVSLWLTFPYFFLVSMGALQSIPTELYEAARVDGGGPWQLFRKVTLPLLLVAVAPLLIASFAFNFNNIYLLTGGGPGTGAAGSTDILISYTYKLAFAAGKGSDYGLASAVSIVIFFIVATISAISFSRTKALENLA
jgi:arabinogalactan oligomer/maltooligosaccharide transport system permease protein